MASRWAVLIVGALSLNACSTGTSSRPLVLCPPIKRYTPEFQLELARALSALPDSSALLTAMSDYLELRQMLRACNSPIISLHQENDLLGCTRSEIATTAEDGEPLTYVEPDGIQSDSSE